MSAPTSDQLREMPLWRLLVLLEDTERELGATCSTARLIARIVSERLKEGRPTAPKKAVPS